MVNQRLQSDPKSRAQLCSSLQGHATARFWSL
jgi:hypothetical protein